MKSNWQSKVATPYRDWEAPQLQTYLKAKGYDTKKATESNKDSLVKQVKNYWTESADSASNSYNSVKDWIFDGSSSSLTQLTIFTDIFYAVGPILSSKLSQTNMTSQYRNLENAIH